MKVVTESWLFKLPLLKHYSAIVLGRRCYIKHAVYSRELLAHELIHQEQMDRVGVLWFYIIYLKDYVKNLVRYRNHWKAYYEIPFEKEAYAREQLVCDAELKSKVKLS